WQQVREPTARGHRALLRGKDLQQRRPGLEPHLLLELPQPECRGQTGRRAAPTHRATLRVLRAVPETIHRNLLQPVRLRLGLARPDAERNSRTAGDQQRRHSADDPGQAPADLRCLGARLLHRLAERAAQVRRGLLEAGELGLRRQEHERLSSRKTRRAKTKAGNTIRDLKETKTMTGYVG